MIDPRLLKQLTKFKTAPEHIQYGKFARDNETLFIFKLGLLERKPKTGLKEAVLAAQKLYELTNEPLVLCMSAGIDSETMAEAFLKAKVPFKVAILKFNNNLNEHDITLAIDYCQQHAIAHDIIDIDIIDFFESGKFYEYGQKYQCQSPQLACHLWLMDQIDGLPVLSGNPIAPTLTIDQVFFVGLPGDLHSTYFRYLDFNNRLGAPWFLLQSAELTAALLNTPCMQPFIKHQVHGAENYTYKIKCQSYKEAGFSTLPRQDKQTGFERLRDYYDQQKNDQYGQAFDKMFRKPLEELNPLPDHYIQMVPMYHKKEAIKRRGWFF